MPGWHESTKQWQKEGKLRVVGIIQEQHPDRAGLFMQWRQMDWPILVDSLNLLGVSAVPITLAIDEHGVIRAINPERDTLERTFLNQVYPKPQHASPAGVKTPDLEKLKKAPRRGGVADWRAYADALVMWAGPNRLDDAIGAYREALKLQPDHGPSHFRLGVAFRKRYESSYRQTDDFQQAVESWTKALEIDPNQYTWRRRIQQYGPRLDKPYPFYNWVTTARREIEARGETPVALAVEPGGAEFAEPLKSFEVAHPPKKAPDAHGRVLRDKERFILIERALVPPSVASGESARVHLTFRPNSRIKAHWNNEAEDLILWIDPPEGWEVDSRLHSSPNPKPVASQEKRTIEFELKCPGKVQSRQVTIPGYALYYVCEDVNGTCLYRRQDVVLNVRVKATP